MQLPKIYSYDQRDIIPYDYGIYAFYLDFNYIIHSMSQSEPSGSQLDRLLGKIVRAHTASNPQNSQFNIFGRTKTFTAVYDLQASHLIRRGEVPVGLTASQLRELAAVLDKCGFFAAPIYIGIAEKQPLAYRYNQHRTKYQRLKEHKAIETGNGRSAFDRSGSFPHNLIRRGLEFRHLVFACVLLNPQEIVHARFVEKLFHAVVNPALSESH